MDDARVMGIAAGQLSWQEGKIWYRSHNYQTLAQLDWPSADTLSLRQTKNWGQAGTKPKGKQSVSNFLNVEKMLADIMDCKEPYPDMGIFNDFFYGGDANLYIPFESMKLEKNYSMPPEGKVKLERKLKEEVRKDFITLLATWEELRKEFPRLRVHPMGLIPKSRRDRQMKRDGILDDIRYRTISDMKKKLMDGWSINLASGSFGTIKLPQGNRLLDLISAAQEKCSKHGLDPRGLVLVKWDMWSAYRNFRISIADRWAFGFTFEGKYGVHKSWPFGNVASVYNFLRFPLMLVWYLGQLNQFIASSEAAMYFDDLIVLAHESKMQASAKVVGNIFRDWKIPRQEEKFLNENANGLQGASRGVILGHMYDFKKGTIGISADRITEILDEMQLFMTSSEKKKIKDWESTVGVLAWVKVVVPQIGPAMSNSYSLIRAWSQAGGKGQRKMTEKIEKDWVEITRLIKKWNGEMSFIRSKWPKSPNRDAFGVEPELYIEPSADASGSIGWGGVCEFGYVRGLWTEEEMGLKIHIKEGLALWAVIRAFGKELKGRKMKLKQFAMRSDNKVLIAGINKGRSRFEDMNIVIKMIFDELLTSQLSLSTWRVRAQTQVKVLFIGTKENVMADALSRDDLETFHNYTDKNKLTVFPRISTHRQLRKEDMKIWKSKVREILKITHMQNTQTRQQQ